MSDGEINEDEGSTEFWRAINEGKRERRHERAADAVSCLKDHGIVFRTKDNVHLIIEDAIMGRVDYWPTTGLWMAAQHKLERCGIEPLLKFLGCELATAV